MDHAYARRLVDATGQQARDLLRALSGGIGADLPHRETMRAVKTLVVADLTGADTGTPDRPEPLVGALLDHLEQLQGETGLFDGDNLVSPPDSAFTVNDICLVVEILQRPGPAGERWNEVRERLRTIAAATVEGLVTGGVHTPNHRWELAAALAGLDHVVGDPRLRPRIEQWLAEGIDVDEDGFFSERSAIYASVVTGPSLVTLARLLHRDSLLDPVRANLATLATLVDEDGEVVTVHSRRQDQRETFHVGSYLSLLRRFAICDGDPHLARLAELAAAADPPDLPEPSRHLAEALVDPVLLKDLPAPAPAPVGQFTWPTVGLVRRLAAGCATTVFAGTDTRATGRIASGLANNATVFQFRHGRARLLSLRISPAFFDTGAFRPTGLRVEGDQVVLTEYRDSGYYQPLPEHLRDPAGRYRLTDEGRFFASMDFGARTRSTLSLESRMTLRLSDDGGEIELSWTGPRTRVGIEFVLGPGDLEGVQEHSGLPGTSRLESDRLGLTGLEDGLEIEIDGHDLTALPDFDDGEIFGYVHGEDRVPGQRVLAGAWTDGTVRIRVRGRDLA